MRQDHEGRTDTEMRRSRGRESPCVGKTSNATSASSTFDFEAGQRKTLRRFCGKVMMCSCHAQVLNTAFIAGFLTKTLGAFAFLFAEMPDITRSRR